MKNPRFTVLLSSLVAARERTRRITAPASAADLRALQRRVIAARLGGDSRPINAGRELFDDVQ